MLQRWSAYGQFAQSVQYVELGAGKMLLPLSVAIQASVGTSEFPGWQATSSTPITAALHASSPSCHQQHRPDQWPQCIGLTETRHRVADCKSHGTLLPQDHISQSTDLQPAVSMDWTAELHHFRHSDAGFEV